jgi:hypothetical protein
MESPAKEAARNDEEAVPGHPAHRRHLRSRQPHRTRSALSRLRDELEALYNELTAALLADGKGKK